MSFLVQESVSLGAPIIGVTFNYRLSGAGFLPGSLAIQSGAANLGLYDQRLALSWIHDNIAAFGGDPSKVTIQGESAGAISVGHQFLAYGGRDDGLFRAGIMQSGGVGLGQPFLPLEDQDVLYHNVLNRTGCISSNDTLNCLRDVPIDTLMAAFRGVDFCPTIDGDLVAEHPVVALEKGRFVHRPILTGTNTNEGTSFAISEHLFPNTTADFRTAVGKYLGGGAAETTIDAIAAEYLEKKSPQKAQITLGTVLPNSVPAYGALYGRATLFRGDVLFIAPRRFSTKTWAKYNVPAYSYRFDTQPKGIAPEILGVAHYSEIPFVFGNINGVGHETNFLASDSVHERKDYVRLSKQMSRMWLSFVNELSPNAHYARAMHVPWPAYTNRTQVNMLFRENGPCLEQDNWRSSAISRLNAAAAPPA